jgi:hypothetical protein
MGQNMRSESDALRGSSTCYHGRSQILRLYKQFELAYRYITKKRMNWAKQRLQNSQWFQNTTLCSGKKLGYVEYGFSTLASEKVRKRGLREIYSSACSPSTIRICAQSVPVAATTRVEYAYPVLLLTHHRGRSIVDRPNPCHPNCGGSGPVSHPCNVKAPGESTLTYPRL